MDYNLSQIIILRYTITELVLHPFIWINPPILELASFLRQIVADRMVRKIVSIHSKINSINYIQHEMYKSNITFWNYV